MSELSEEELAEKWRRTKIEGQQTFDITVASEVPEEELKEDDKQS
jgi:hypothetical protein